MCVCDKFGRFRTDCDKKKKRKRYKKKNKRYKKMLIDASYNNHSGAEMFDNVNFIIH